MMQKMFLKFDPKPLEDKEEFSKLEVKKAKKWIIKMIKKEYFSHNRSLSNFIEIIEEGLGKG